MNLAKIPGLRAEDEFSREYKALSLLIGDLEERSETIAMDKKREVDTKKVDLFDASKSISNQIQETNKELEKKLAGNLNYMEDLETNVDGLRKTTGKLIAEFKKALNDLGTKSTEQLIDSKVRDQVANAKNLFFKKVLREIVVGNEKIEEIIRALEAKLALKGKLLKKALLGAEHYRVRIEFEQNKYQALKRKDEDFFKKISNAISFGHVNISEEMNNIEAKKLFNRGDFRTEKGIRDNLGIKDRLLLVENDRFLVYNGITAGDPIQTINFAEIKEINLIKEEVDRNYNLGSLDSTDPNKIGSIFFVKYKNERGGFVIETDSNTTQKWDYIFFVVNTIIANNITNSLRFFPFTLEANNARLTKNINTKTFDPVVVSRHNPPPYDYPMEDSKQTIDVEDTLIDWQILEHKSSEESTNLLKRILLKSKANASMEYISENSKAVQTDFKFSAVDGDSPVATIGGGATGMIVPSKTDQNRLQDPRYKAQEFNYQIPSLSNFVNDADLVKIYGDSAAVADKNNTNKTTLNEGQELASPQVELDMSFESRSDQEQLMKDEKRGGDTGGEGGKRPGALGVAEGGVKGAELGVEAFGKMGDLFALDKTDMDSLTMEKAYRQNIKKTLYSGVKAKGSGMGNNSGNFVVKTSSDFLFIERYDSNSKRKESKKVMSITEIAFKFEYKDLRLEQIVGATIIVVSFIDQTYWEFKTPRKNKNLFYTSLMHYRLNFREFQVADKS